MEKIFFNDKEIENIKINNELEDKEKKLNPNKIQKVQYFFSFAFITSK